MENPNYLQSQVDGLLKKIRALEAASWIALKAWRDEEDVHVGMSAIAA